MHNGACQRLQKAHQRPQEARRRLRAAHQRLSRSLLVGVKASLGRRTSRPHRRIALPIGSLKHLL